MQITKEIRRTINEIKKRHGQVSESWLQYKYKISFKEAEKVLKEFSGVKNVR